jgi:hypothetical protein
VKTCEHTSHRERRGRNKNGPRLFQPGPMGHKTANLSMGEDKDASSGVVSTSPAPIEGSARGTPPQARVGRSWSSPGAATDRKKRRGPRRLRVHPGGQVNPAIPTGGQGLRSSPSATDMRSSWRLLGVFNEPLRSTTASDGSWQASSDPRTRSRRCGTPPTRPSPVHTADARGGSVKAAMRRASLHPAAGMAPDFQPTLLGVERTSHRAQSSSIACAACVSTPAPTSGGFDTTSGRNPGPA